MKKVTLIIILFLISCSMFPQNNIPDTFRLLLNPKYPDSTKIDKLNKLIFEYAPNYPEIVIRYSDTAIGLSTKFQDSNRLAYSYNRKGVALYYLGDYNGALENYFNALKIKEKTGNTDEIWREYNNIGLVLRNLEQNEEALTYFKIALEPLINSRNKKAEAIVWNNIGISLRGLKQYEEAKMVLYKALAINTSIGAKLAMAQDFNNLGNIFFVEKNFQMSIEYYSKSLVINTELHNRYEQAQNMNNLADSYLSIGNYPLAKKYLKEAEELLNITHAAQLKMNNLNITANYYFRTKEFEKALYYKDRYSKIRDSIYFEARAKQFKQLKSIANAEKEIQELSFLKKINTIQAEKIRVQRIIEYGGMFVIMLILFVFFIVVRNLKIKRSLNISLEQHSIELSNLNEKLQSSNEELLYQHDALYKQREELERTLNTLQSTQNQLIQAEKMASLGVLAAGVAHEINNPLNFIHAGIIGLENYFSDNLVEHQKQVNPMINGIREGVRRTTSIITSLNQYSEQDNQKKKDCNIHQIIDNCLIMLNSQKTDKIVIKKRYTIEPLSLVASDSKLHQAILNILINSIQAIDTAGEINISTKLMNEEINIIISDTGIGIEPEDLSKIFDPFFTRKDPGKGTGLGLSISYNIIKEHGGTIDIDSDLNTGTIVLVKLPVIKN